MWDGSAWSLSDTTYFLIAQGIGWAAMIVSVLRFQLKTSRQIRLGNVMSAGLFAVHYAFLFSWTASVLCAIATVRSGLLSIEKFWDYKTYIAAGSILFCMAATVLTYQSWVDLLALAGLCMGALIDIQHKAILTRFFGVFGKIIWLVFNILVGSQGGAANNAVNLASNFIGFWRHQLYPYLKTGDKSHFRI